MSVWLWETEGKGTINIQKDVWKNVHQNVDSDYFWVGTFPEVFAFFFI
jgi:hypothetical protein